MSGCHTKWLTSFRCRCPSFCVVAIEGTVVCVCFVVGVFFPPGINVSFKDRESFCFQPQCPYMERQYKEMKHEKSIDDHSPRLAANSLLYINGEQEANQLRLEPFYWIFGASGGRKLY